MTHDNNSQCYFNCCYCFLTFTAVNQREITGTVMVTCQLTSEFILFNGCLFEEDHYNAAPYIKQIKTVIYNFNLFCLKSDNLLTN